MFNLLQIPVYSIKFPQFYTFIPDRSLFQSGGPLYLIDLPSDNKPQRFWCAF